MALNQMNQHDYKEVAPSYIDTNLARNSSQQLSGMSDYRNSQNSYVQSTSHQIIPNTNQNSIVTLPNTSTLHKVSLVNGPHGHQSSGVQNSQKHQYYTHSHVAQNHGYQQQASQNMQTSNFYNIQTPNYTIDHQPALMNNYTSDGIGGYDLQHVDDVSNILQMCSPNPHSSLGLSQFQQYQNHNMIQNQSNSKNMNHLMKTEPKTLSQFGIQHQQYSQSRDVYMRDQSPQQTPLYLHNHEPEIQSAKKTLSYQKNFQNQDHYQKLPGFSEIQHHQNSLSKEFIGGSNNLNIFNQGSQKLLNSPYFGCTPHPEQQTPSNRLDLILCHGQKEHEKEENSQNIISQQGFSQNLGSMGVSTAVNSANESNQRDSMFSNNDTNKLPHAPISPLSSQKANLQENVALMPEIDEQDSKNNISQILFTPNNQERFGVTTNMGPQSNLFSKDLFEHVTKSREQRKNQLKLERSDSDVNMNINKKKLTQKHQNQNPIQLDIEMNQHSIGSQLQEFHEKNNYGSFCKFENSPQFNFQQIINTPLSPTEYHNYNFNEEHSFLQHKDPCLPIHSKKERSSNSQYELTFSKQESIDHVPFSNMVAQSIQKNQQNSSKISHQCCYYYHYKDQKPSFQLSHNPGNQSCQSINSNNIQSQEQTYQGRESSNSGTFQFCQQCHQENLRKLLEDEQKKLKELEFIKIEKAQIMNNVAKMKQDYQDNFMIFFCDKVEGSMTRKIGQITLQERYKKIKRYKEKKENRIWKKKISYDCRKQVADKRLRIKGRFVSKAGQKLLFQDIFGNGEIFPEDIKGFNEELKQVMSDYQRGKMLKSKLGVKDFLIHQHDDKGVRHSFFDFKKFSNFIEEDEENEAKEEKKEVSEFAKPDNKPQSQLKQMLQNVEKNQQIKISYSQSQPSIPEKKTKIDFKSQQKEFQLQCDFNQKMNSKRQFKKPQNKKL